ncbi:CynX/NimT family MFS transporter [Planomonospora venezuelensis]|uniref:CP family cyanate transporter-like MFS transporter n=1 Tax=Planomonospora venezuelensis TaxID=1999 RepID=A0A841D9N5_PLAVE|nr:MFS transporter [Planomonospora venezuelensis]MBB5966901.1 CP family cyanate transporter-like MFS transporter [Planomonospora venezuelensis]GIN02402.1 MFS transporter [Planomonospora venezuelensis]
MSVLTHESRGRTDGTPGSLAWLLVLGIVLAALNLRTAVTSVGPVLDHISAGLGMSGAGIGLLTTLPVLIFATVGAVTPALARKAGEHRLLLLGLLALGAGLLTRAMVDSAVVFLFSSALALSGGAVGNVLIPTLIKRHFPGRAGTMTTVYTTALAVGTMLAAAATVPIERAADGNWHVALGVWAALAAVAALPWLLLLRSEPERAAGTAGLGMRTLVRSRLAWAVAAYFGTQSMVAYIMFGFLPKILTDGGLTTGQAGLLLGVFTAIGIPVSLVVPSVATRFADQRPVVAAFVALYAAGFLGLWLAPASWAWLFTILVGIGMGSFPLALTMLALRTRTPEATAALSAFGQSAGYLIAGAGPLVVGVMHESTGGWTAPFLFLFAVVAVQLAVGWYAGRSRYLEDERALAR